MQQLNVRFTSIIFEYCHFMVKLCYPSLNYFKTVRSNSTKKIQFRLLVLFWWIQMQRLNVRFTSIIFSKWCNVSFDWYWIGLPIPEQLLALIIWHLESGFCTGFVFAHFFYANIFLIDSIWLPWRRCISLYRADQGQDWRIPVFLHLPFSLIRQLLPFRRSLAPIHPPPISMAISCLRSPPVDLFPFY